MVNSLRSLLSPSPGYGEGGPKDRERLKVLKRPFPTLSVGYADTSPIKGEEKFSQEAA